MDRYHEGGLLEERKSCTKQAREPTVQGWRFALEYFLELDSVASVCGFDLRQERQWCNQQILHKRQALCQEAGD